MLSKRLLDWAHCLAALIFTLGCGTGDDDGNRLGDQIVGTWYRDSLTIVGDSPVDPEDLTYHHFVFSGDGTYNGMVRSGSFSAISRFGNLIYEGTYKCDNDNLRLEYNDEGTKRKIHAQVLSFTPEEIYLRYENEEYAVTVYLTLSIHSPSSSSSSSTNDD